MSKRLDISPFEEQLRDQFSSMEVPAPDEVWSGLDQHLDQMNTDLQFDQGIKENLGQAQVNPPTSVWQGIQSGLSGAAGSAGTAALVGKWILGVVVAGSVSYGAYSLFNTSDKALTSEEDKVLVADENQIDQNDNTEQVANLKTTISENGPASDGTDKDLELPKKDEHPAASDADRVRDEQNGHSNDGKESANPSPFSDNPNTNQSDDGTGDPVRLSRRGADTAV